VLYHRRQGPIFRFALHMSGSAQIAEEVTQDVFMFLLQRGQGFDAERGALGAYLFGVARNYVRRALERNYPEMMLSSPVEDEAASLLVENDPSEGIARRQTRRPSGRRCFPCRNIIARWWCCAICRSKVMRTRPRRWAVPSAPSDRGCIGRTTC